MEFINNLNYSINLEYSLVTHLKLLSENDAKYKDLYATWIIDEKVYTNALKAIVHSFPHYSIHDSSHSWSIINKIEMILGEERIRKLTATDTFIMLESAFLHDLGMIIGEKDQEDLWVKPEFKKYIEETISNNNDIDLVNAANYIKDIEKNGIGSNKKTWPVKIKSYVTILNADYFRKKHNIRSADFIMNSEDLDILSNRNKLIPERIMRLIAQISIMHGSDFKDVMDNLCKEDNGIATDRIHPRMIACLLRLGDLLDLDNNRFNYTIEKTVLMPKTSIEQKEKHQAITHFLVSPQKIEVSSICPNESVYRATRQWFDWLQDELKNLSSKWSDIVANDFIGGPPSLGDIKLSIKDQNGITEQLNFKFNIDQKLAFEFIEGSGIYENKLDCIREIIQNALDATKMQIWNDINIGKYNSFEECEDIINKLQFSSEIPKVIKNMYPLKIKLDYIGYDDVEDQAEFKITIEDSGCGISLTDLKRMESVGHSWNDDIEKYKVIEKMPYWMRPTGNFGIGLHSVFMITDRVEIETKAENSEGYYITFISSKNNGYISTQINKNRKKNGTKISFSFKSKFIEEFQYNIFNNYISEKFDTINTELDIVDNEYKSKKDIKKMCILLNSYIKNINWIKVECEGILDKDNCFKNNEIIEYNEKNNNIKKFDDITNLEIIFGFNKSRILSAFVKDKDKFSEMNFNFIKLSPYDIKNKEYLLSRMLRTTKRAFRTDMSEIYYKNIFCTHIYSNVFKTKLNIVEGQAKQLLSINRNRFIDNSILDTYIDRVNNYIVKQVILKMWEYISNLEGTCNFSEQDYMDMIILVLYYKKYYGNIDVQEELKDNVIFNKWTVRDFNKINSNEKFEKMTLKEILSEKNIMLSPYLDEETVIKAKKYDVNTVLEGYIYNTDMFKVLGFDKMEQIDEDYYIVYKEDNLDNLDRFIIDYNNKELVKIILNGLYDYTKVKINMRTSIDGFEYKNKDSSQIRCLITIDNNIISPFTRDIEKEFFKKNIDDIIFELKKNYKFNELIQYVYNNSLNNELFKNKDYKKIIENAYKELIEDYINFVYVKEDKYVIEKEIEIEVPNEKGFTM